MDESETTRLLQEIREIQKSQLELFQAANASLAVQRQELVDERAKWIEEREKLRQTQMAIQVRQNRARQWIRLYILALILIGAFIWYHKLGVF